MYSCLHVLERCALSVHGETTTLGMYRLPLVSVSKLCLGTLTLHATQSSRPGALDRSCRFCLTAPHIQLRHVSPRSHTTRESLVKVNAFTRISRDGWLVPRHLSYGSLLIHASMCHWSSRSPSQDSLSEGPLSRSTALLYRGWRTHMHIYDRGCCRGVGLCIHVHIHVVSYRPSHCVLLEDGDYLGYARLM